MPKKINLLDDQVIIYIASIKDQLARLIVNLKSSGQADLGNYADFMQTNIYDKYYAETMYQFEQDLVELHNKLIVQDEISSQEQVSYVKLAMQVKDRCDRINACIRRGIFEANPSIQHEVVLTIKKGLLDNSQNIFNKLTDYLVVIDPDLKQKIFQE